MTRTTNEGSPGWEMDKTKDQKKEKDEEKQ